ncbi:hypothetical protein B0T24DRAFT_676485 [Lasiosphaeria ovina]|uniref:Uncharacterized protein n=1 Tax=Lasiosphaeria ovina TaxID=92902 RepID=A0AAE0N9U4_9PEZI|nr:hypothetical protein B0T24DRAFT_676485 [Lasiosphaeria ovina]
MAAYTITSISRVTNDDLNTDIRVGFGDANAPGGGMRMTVRDDHIYSAADPVHPAAFMYAANHIPLVVSGSHLFPAGVAAYRVRGTGPNNFTITTQPFNVTGVAGTAVNFGASVFSNAGGAPGSPFKVVGNWTWSILNGTTGAVIATSAATPLELYFFFGDHCLPYIYSQTHFLELIRLSIPTYDIVAGQAWAAIELTIIWNAVVNLWNHGGAALCYDSRFRKGGVAEHLRRNNFNLGSIMTRSVATCNCFDLAALAKLTLLSLGRNTNGEPMIAGTALQVDRPWGYIFPGPLFGWANTAAHNCNSPFWQERLGGPGHDTQPLMAQNDANRTAFDCHCYAVYDDHTNVKRVIDICHATLTGPPAAAPGPFNLAGGLVDVPNFRAAGIDVGAIPFGAPVVSEQVVNWVDL